MPNDEICRNCGFPSGQGHNCKKGKKGICVNKADELSAYSEFKNIKYTKKMSINEQTQQFGPHFIVYPASGLQPKEGLFQGGYVPYRESVEKITEWGLKELERLDKEKEKEMNKLRSKSILI